MEYVQKYWYIVAGVLVLLFVVSRNRSQAVTVSGGGDTVALASIASAEREADENRKYNLFSTLLNYDLQTKDLQQTGELNRIQLSQQIRLAEISATAQNQVNAQQMALAQMQYQAQQQQYQQQLALQQYQVDRAYNAQRRSDWIGAIGTGIQTILPNIFGSTTSRGGFGGYSTPPFNGGGFTFGF